MSSSFRVSSICCASSSGSCTTDQVDNSLVWGSKRINLSALPAAAWRDLEASQCCSLKASRQPDGGNTELAITAITGASRGSPSQRWSQM